MIVISKPKILLFDIETMANKAYVWGKYEQDVIAYEQEWYILCFAYKWLGDKKTNVLSLPDYKDYKKNKENDFNLVKDLHKLFDEADIVVAHNGNQFDIKKVNARFLYHGFKPPSPYKAVDTKQIAKRYFAFNSNKLDDLGEILGVGRKFKHQGFSLWLKCAKGDKKAWVEMIKYNKQDVVLLEKVYNKLLPYIQNFPSVRKSEYDCVHCGSNHTQKRGKQMLKNSKYRVRFQCTDCGAWGAGDICK